MDEVEVPPYYLCPISMEIMRDPVTVTSGITYERSSIEKWLFSTTAMDPICPVTKQLLLSQSIKYPGEILITPNHTLRRLIQAWCTLNTSSAIHRFPTPKPPLTKIQISKLLNDALKTPESLSQCLRTLNRLAGESDANKRSMEAFGVIEFLRSIVIHHIYDSTIEAVDVLHHLKVTEPGLKLLLIKTHCEEDSFVDSIVKNILQQRGISEESITYAMQLLESILRLEDPMELFRLTEEFLGEILCVLSSQISIEASKSALQILVHLCPWGCNRVKASKAGAVSVLIEILLSKYYSKSRRMCEMALVALDLVCECAEGRAELLGHAAGLAVVSKKILRVSNMANEHAMRVLLAVAKYSGYPSVVQEMLEIGVVEKLCLLLHGGGGRKVGVKAAEILKLHIGAWNNSACIPSCLRSSFPS